MLSCQALVFNLFLVVLQGLGFLDPGSVYQKCSSCVKLSYQKDA